MCFHTRFGFGEPTQRTDPLGDLSNTYRDTNGFPYVVADALSRRTRYFFDTLENPTKTVFADDNYEQRTFNSFSEVTKFTDALGNVSTYGYDTNGNNTQIIDALSHTTTMTYTTHGFLLTSTDPNSHTTTYGYDSRSRLTSITDALSHTETMAYDSASNKTGQTDFNGNVSTYTYSAEALLLTTTLPGSPNSVTTYGYDSARNLTTITDPLSHVTTLGYDNLNREISSTDPLSDTTTYGYDENGNQTTLTDPLSHVTTYSYDAANRLTAVTDANSHTTSYGYDAAGEQVTVTDALSHVTTYAYNNRGWLTSVTDPNNNVTQHGFDADGNETTLTRTDTSGQLTILNPEVTTFTYDAARRKTSMIDPLNHTTSYGYDPANNQTTVTDPLTHVTTTAYDADNRLISVTDALGHTVTYGYDNNGNRTTVTDALSRVTTYGYDGQNRLITVTDPLTGVTTYAYDQASRQTSIKDADSNTTTYAYDNANRLTTVTDPNNHTTTYAYDNANRLTSVTDRNGRQITYSYDNAGNKTGETWVNGSYVATYTYDAANRLTVEQDTFSKYTLGYDAGNRLTSVDNSGTPNAPHLVLNYGYDHFDNVSSISDNITVGMTENFTYDGSNRLITVSINNSQWHGNDPQIGLGYDNADRLTSLTRTQLIGGSGNSVATTYSYDNGNRLTGITHSSSAVGTLMTLTYGYDSANQLTSYSGPDGSITYGYDADGQLTGATGAHNETYTYDKEGNRTMSGWTTSTGNRLTADGTYTYAYDNDGNMVGRTRTSDGQVTTYTYDFRNRLTEVLIKTSTGTTVQDDKFTYDIENRRIGKNTLSGGQSWTGYDRADPYADFNSGGSLTYRYLYGEAIDFLLARVDTNGVPMWYLTDKLGSVRENVNTSGTVLDSITYDSYGNILSESNSSNGDRFKFTGREWDSEIGQYYYRARNYAANIGRFESEDPLGFGGKDTNLYRYVKNSPTDFSDPRGTIIDLMGAKTKAQCLKELQDEMAVIEKDYEDCIFEAAQMPPGQAQEDQLLICLFIKWVDTAIAIAEFEECMKKVPTPPPGPGPSRNKPAPVPVRPPAAPDPIIVTRPMPPILEPGRPTDLLPVIIGVIGVGLLFVPGAEPIGVAIVVGGVLFTNPTPAYAGQGGPTRPGRTPPLPRFINPPNGGGP